MANLTDKSYFRVDIKLPTSNLDDYETFFTKFEPKCLIYLLGYDLYKLLLANKTVEPYKSLLNGVEYQIQYNGSTRTIKWNGLINDDKISLIAYYVYIEIMRKSVTSSQSVGETKSKQQNSFNADIFNKIMSSQVSFEELYGSSKQNKLIPSAYNYLYEHKDNTAFKTWEFTDLIGNINSHDL